ncbi:MAG TPA: TIGR04372 family glycosyltransferase [Terriglobia bacterium]|nr:TIGR04372 family glycosyltransferase [Terriglobia bacterium]
MREPGFHKAWHEKHPGTRNADVLTYMKAVHSIIDRGGYVVRMGDPTMKELPLLEGLIDYAHSEMKSEEMDVFLCGKARFFIGTNSGLGLVPPIFGVPCALTNWSPIALPQWYPRDRFIPKRIYSKQLKRNLTFEEMFASPAGWQQFNHYFESEELEVIDNTPEEIDELILEVLDETEGKATWSDEDQRLLEAYNEVVLRHGSYVGARIGRVFLLEHQEQFPLPEALKNKAEKFLLVG